MEIPKATIRAYQTMMKALSNENRLEIMHSLHDKPKTWTELLFELQINPKSLRDHLSFLKKSGLIKKKEPIGFELTGAGRAFIELSLERIIETAKQAAEIAQNEFV